MDITVTLGESLVGSLAYLGHRPVADRVRVDAAAALISESGLAAATLEAIANRADCAVHSLYMSFGSRDELVRFVFERHSPIPDFEDVVDTDTDDLTATVRRLYQALAAALSREPRVAPGNHRRSIRPSRQPDGTDAGPTRRSSDAGCAWDVVERAGATGADT